MQADVLQPPLLQPVFSFWSPIPTRTRTMTAQLQGNQILPLPGYQNQVILGAIRQSLANVATFVSLDAITPSNQGGHALYGVAYANSMPPPGWHPARMVACRHHSEL